MMMFREYSNQINSQVCVAVVIHGYGEEQSKYINQIIHELLINFQQAICYTGVDSIHISSDYRHLLGLLRGITGNDEDYSSSLGGLGMTVPKLSSNGKSVISLNNILFDEVLDQSLESINLYIPLIMRVVFHELSHSEINYRLYSKFDVSSIKDKEDYSSRKPLMDIYLNSISEYYANYKESSWFEENQLSGFLSNLLSSIDSFENAIAEIKLEFIEHLNIDRLTYESYQLLSTLMTSFAYFSGCIEGIAASNDNNRAELKIDKLIGTWFFEYYQQLVKDFGNCLSGLESELAKIDIREFSRIGLDVLSKFGINIKDTDSKRSYVWVS